MLEESLKPRAFEEGQSVEGTVVALSDDVAFVDVGGKGEASIDLEELRNEDGELEAAVGDKIVAIVVSTAGGLRLSRRLARGAGREAAAPGRLPRGTARRGARREGDQGRLRHQDRRGPRVLPDLPDRQRLHHRPRRARGKVYAFRIVEYREGAGTSSFRGACSSRKKSASRPRS